jgi:diguanylate cyclase (GGDEF)-like protein
MPPETPQDAPGPTLRIAVAAPPALEPRLRALLGREPALAAVFLRDLCEARVGADECSVVLFPIEAEGEILACAGALRACVERAGVPVIAYGERLAPGLARAALEAGAADCLALDAAPSEQLRLAIARAAARGALLALERSRADDLEQALRRAQEACARERAAAITDWITGLYNKRYLEERLAEEENVALRTGTPVALVLADIDHFKLVNDAYGHQAGDRVLREVAGVIRACLRNYDVPCRYGGEEFGLLLPMTARARAGAVAERIRAELKAHRFPGALAGLRITASFGVADLPAASVSSREELLQAADRALYRAKSEGRDRTCVAEEGLRISSRGAPAPRPDVVRLERLRGAIRDLTEGLAETFLERWSALVSTAHEPWLEPAGAIARKAAQIGEALGLDAGQVRKIRRAGLFQDIGMIALGAAVAHEGALGEAEWELVRQHPALSVRILDEVQFLREELPLILYHHERWDGSGYPRGLSGDRIPLGARVLAVATAFEAMGRDRPYRGALPPEVACGEIERLAGVWYDPGVVRAFLATAGARSA